MSLRERIARIFYNISTRLATVTTEVRDEQKGWTALRSRPNDRDISEIQKLYRDALEATRRNPMAKAVVDITTDFVLGDGIQISSNHKRIQSFLVKFWNHPLNAVDQKLQAMSDEITRAGDLFIVLFRNSQDGMSYLRFIPKEQIISIDTAPNDWETEIAYYQITDDPTAPKRWLSPHHPQSSDNDAVMLHYAINRPVGASFGEGDLDTVIPWLLRYSRMLEDRVRLHWAVRTFLWFVTVPTNLVERKQAEYSTPPEAGSIIVKDDAEEWTVEAPTLHAADAQHDLQAVRHMIDAVGYPPHWRGEGGDANLATATAMQLRPERHLRRRQNLMVYILQDIVYQSYLRAAQLTSLPMPRTPFHRLFNANVSDISRSDNQTLATAAKELGSALQSVFEQIPPRESPTLAKLSLRLMFKFAGEPQEDRTLNNIMREAGYDMKDIEDIELSTGPPGPGRAAHVIRQATSNGRTKEPTP
jgi:hypothetical protein